MPSIRHILIYAEARTSNVQLRTSLLELTRQIYITWRKHRLRNAEVCIISTLLNDYPEAHLPHAINLCNYCHLPKGPFGRDLRPKYNSRPLAQATVILIVSNLILTNITVLDNPN